MIAESTRYENEVMRRLEAFKNAVEWSDFIGLLGNLDAVLEKYKLPYIPHHALLVKRLNQCLNPVLPAGVHLKTLETYARIFAKLPRESLVADFSVLTLGLFAFGTRCRILVTNEYLDLLEHHIVPLVPDVPVASILVGLLPTLESESSEFYDHTLLIFMRLQNQIEPNIFWNALWHTFLDHPGLHVSIVNFMSKTKQLLLPDYRLAVGGLCRGLESESMYTIRSMLDLVSYDYPLKVTIVTGQDGRTVDITRSGDGKLSLEMYNGRLIRSVLKLFLKKEAGVNRRVFKWLAIGNENTPPALRSIEAGLRTYISGDARDMQTLFKILFSLSDKERLKPVILDLILFDMISCLRRMGGEPEKLAKPFKDLGLDYIYRIFYLRLEESLNAKSREELSGNEGDDMKAAHEGVSQGGNGNVENASELGGQANKVLGGLNEHTEDSRNRDDSSNIKPDVVKDEHSDAPGMNTAARKWTATEILDMLIYTIDDLRATDSNAKAIHLPLLANLIVRNRASVDEGHFNLFLNLFFAHAAYQPEKSASSVSISSITEAYRTESFKAILDADLVSLVAHEYSSLCGKESAGQPFELKPGGMCLKDGVVVHEDELSIERPEGRPSSTKESGENGGGNGNARGSADNEDVNGLRTSISAASTHLSFTAKELQIIQRFIQSFSTDVFSDNFLKLLAASLVRNYRYKFLVDKLAKYIDQEELHKSIWSDFVRTNVSTFLLFYDLSDFIINALHNMDREFIFLLLSASLNQQKYCGVFFLLSTVGERDSPEFTRLILTINKPLPLLVYLVELYNDCNTYSVSFRYLEQPNYNKIASILKLLAALLDNAMVVQALNSNCSVSIDRFDCKGVAECICRMLSNLIINEEGDAGGSDGETESSEDGHAAVADASAGPTGNSIEEFNASISKHANASQASIQDSALGPASSVYFKSPHCAAHQRIQMEVFKLLDKLHQKGVPVVLPSMDRVKVAIAARRNVFHITIRSLFLVEDDISFIIRNCLTNFNEVFFEISRMGIKWKFFNVLVKKHERLTIEMLYAMFNYTIEIPKFDWNNFYEISLRLAGEAMKGPRVGGEESACSESSSTSGSGNASKIDNALERPGSLAIRLCSALYSHNHMLFTKYFVESEAAEDLFAAVPFKNALFTKMLQFENSGLLLKLVKYVEPAARANIFIAKNDYFKSSVYLRIDYSSTMLILYLVSGGGYQGSSYCEGHGCGPEGRGHLRARHAIHSHDNNSPNTADGPILVSLEKYKTILENILYALENRISSGIKLDLDFQHDLDILRAIGPLLAGDASLMANYKSCLFMLLSSRRFCREAFAVIDSAIRRYPGSRPLSDAFVSQMNEGFFKYAVHEKSGLLGLITSSPAFDITSLIDRFFNGLETSYFISHQNSLQQKTQVLKKLAFLILSNPHGRFDAYADRLVSSVNTLLGSSDEIKVETYRLCIAMVLRIDVSLISHLYPLILEDFMGAYEPGANFTEGNETVKAMVQFVDMCMWLHDDVFDFRSLFQPGSTFSKCCISLSISRGTRKEAVKVDYNAFISENGRYVNLMFGAADSNDLTWYFKEAYWFYEHVEVHFYTRDTMRVERMLISSFLEE